MIGSPASRGAVASWGCAGRACFGAASAVSAVSAAIAASVTMAAGPQRRIATVDCAVVNRFTMPCPVGMRVRVCVDVSNRDVWITNSQHHTPPIRSWGLSHVRWQFSRIRQGAFDERWLAAEIGTKRISPMVWPSHLAHARGQILQSNSDQCRAGERGFCKRSSRDSCWMAPFGPII